MRADGEGDNDVVVNYEEDAVAAGDGEIKDLMAVPSDAFELMAVERGMRLIGAEEGELVARQHHFGHRSHREHLGLSL